MTVRKVSNNPASPFYVAACPNITGQVGSLTTFLDAVLVNGFSGYTAPGWTIGQTATNKRQYIMAGGTGKSLWVDDTAAGTGGAKEARTAGYATMSATTPTGTGQFPTNAQSAIATGMMTIRKSTTADATVRYATAICDEKTLYLFTETGDYTAPVACFGFAFGDFASYSSTDTSNCLHIARQVENSAVVGSTNTANSYFEPFAQLSLPTQAALSQVALISQYAAGNFTNVGGSILFGKHADVAKMGWDQSTSAGLQMGYLGRWSNAGNSIWPNEFAYPNPPDNGLYQSPVWIHHNGIVRGYMRGVWCPLQHLPLNHNDTFSGTGNLTGKDFVAIALVGASNGTLSAGYTAQCFIETSNTWPT